MRLASPALVAALFAAALVPASTRAQARTVPLRTAFEVTPYAGYLMAGSLVDGPLGSSVGAAPAPMIGAQLGMRLSPSVSIVGNVATGSSDIKAGIPILGGISVARTRMVLYDAGLQLDLPMSTVSGSSFSPFVQGGIGGIRQEISESLITVTSTAMAANVGIGADVSIGSGVGLRLMAKDYIARFDAQEATTFDIDTDVKQNFALSVGVRFSF